MRRWTWLVSLLLLAACATVPVTRWDPLADDEAVWARCQGLVADRVCSPLTNSSDAAERGACVLQMVADFRQQTGFRAQREWLVTNGCPVQLVSPEQVTFDPYERAANRPAEGMPQRAPAAPPRPTAASPTPPAAATPPAGAPAPAPADPAPAPAPAPDPAPSAAPTPAAPAPAALPTDEPAPRRRHHR